MARPPAWWEVACRQLVRKQEDCLDKHLQPILKLWGSYLEAQGCQSEIGEQQHTDRNVTAAFQLEVSKLQAVAARRSKQSARQDNVESLRSELKKSSAAAELLTTPRSAKPKTAEDVPSGNHTSDTGSKLRVASPRTPRLAGVAVSSPRCHSPPGTPDMLSPRRGESDEATDSYDADDVTKRPTLNRDLFGGSVIDFKTKLSQIGASRTTSGKLFEIGAHGTMSATSTSLASRTISFNNTVSFQSEQGVSELPRVLRNWESLVHDKLTGKRPAPKQPRECVKFHLRPVWLCSGTSAVRGDDRGSRRATVNKRLTTNRTASDQVWGFGEERMGHVMQSDHCTRRFVRHPDKTVSVIYSLVSSAFIMCDVMLMPFSLSFYESFTLFLTWTEWCTAVFWSLDILMSFLQGFHHKDLVEMRPSHIARHYLRCWFWLDLPLVVNDWFVIIASTMNDSRSQVSIGSIARAGHSMRFVRFLRALRVLRLRKAVKTLQFCIDAIARQEGLLIFSRIVGLMVLIAVINHYVACAWYSIGRSASGPAWIKTELLEDDDIGDDTFNKYICAFHWSLTQFTPATNNIAPMNSMERLFSVCVVLFALFVFSTFLSGLTNATMEMKRLNAARMNEEETIRRFMYTKHVSIELGSRVWHFYRNHYRKRGRLEYEVDIPFFQAMPKSLRTGLHLQIYMPKLLQHPLFERFAVNNYPAMVMFCDSAVIERSYIQGEEVFAEAEEAKHMIFITSGVLRYACPFYEKATDVEAPSCVSEAALWSYWIHCGRLTGQSNPSSELMLVDANCFENAVRRAASEKGLAQLRRYAALFAEELNDSMEEQRKRSCVEEAPLATTNSNETYQTSAYEDEQMTLITDVMQDAWLTSELVRRAFNRGPARRISQASDDCSDFAQMSTGRGLVAVAELVRQFLSNGVDRISDPIGRLTIRRASDHRPDSERSTTSTHSGETSGTKINP